MKIYGREMGWPASDRLLELGEVTLLTSSERLRKIARFISEAADQMDLEKDGFDHLHLKFGFREFDDRNGPDIIVAVDYKNKTKITG